MENELIERREEWYLYQKLVLAELERHSKLLTDSALQIAELKVQIAMLQVKAGVWGALGGMLPVIAIILYKLSAK